MDRWSDNFWILVEATKTHSSVRTQHKHLQAGSNKKLAGASDSTTRAFVWTKGSNTGTSQRWVFDLICRQTILVWYEGSGRTSSRPFQGFLVHRTQLFGVLLGAHRCWTTQRRVHLTPSRLAPKVQCQHPLANGRTKVTGASQWHRTSYREQRTTTGVVG